MHYVNQGIKFETYKASKSNERFKAQAGKKNYIIVKPLLVRHFSVLVYFCNAASCFGGFLLSINEKEMS